MSKIFRQFQNGISVRGLPSDPTDPQAGDLYYNTTTNKYRFYNGTIWSDVGSGGIDNIIDTAINYIENGSAKDSTAGWATYADPPAINPVDGVGGAPSITWTRTTSTPLSDPGSFLFTKDATNRRGEGASYNFTIRRSDLGKRHRIKVVTELVSGTYNTGDLTVHIYDVTNNTLLNLADKQLSAASSPSVFETTFYAANNSVNYRFIIHVSTNSTVAFTVKIDNIEVSPVEVPVATVITDEVFGLTGTLITFTKTYKANSHTVFYRNGVKMRKVLSFSTGTENYADEYKEIDLGTLSNQIQLHPSFGATSDEVFSFYYYTSDLLTSADYVLAACRTNGAGTSVNCSVSVSGGKTRITTTFNLSNSTEVYVDGIRYHRFIDSTITPDKYWTLVSPNIIDLDSDYTADALPVQIINFGISPSDNQQQVDDLIDLSKYNANPFVIPQYISPPSTEIQNRKKLLDETNSLTSIFGIERIHFENISEVKDEFGTNGEIVHKLLYDYKERVRFVGNGWTRQVTTNGISLRSNIINDYIEVTFYGTGLNLLMLLTNISGDIRVKVDGGPEGSNIYLSTYSNILAGREYRSHQILRVTSGLPLGWHTVKIRINSTANHDFYGIEILNERTNIRTFSGNAFVNGKKILTPTNIDLNYNSGFDQIEREGAVVGTLGTRGARVVVYQDSNGAIKHRAYATNTTQQNLSSASHLYEDILNTYYFREFGDGRGDDFTSLVGTSNRGFTSSDGTATLLAQGVYVTDAVQSTDGLVINTTNDFITFTFVGTGLDIVAARQTSGGTFNYSVTINNTSVGNVPSPYTNDVFVKIPIVSGLPYGTHTVRITRLSGTDRNIIIREFVVYGQKKPSLPADAYELCEYYLLADFSYNATTSPLTQSTGVIRKVNTSEATYSGTWSIGSINPALLTGFDTSTSTSGAYIEYHFYGTGIVYRFANNTGAQSFTVSINGSNDLSIYSTNLTTSAGLSLTPSTGTVSGTASTATDASSLMISNMPLARYTIRITWGSGAAIRPQGFDVITPIYSSEDQFNLIRNSDFSIKKLVKFSPMDKEHEKFSKIVLATILTGISTTSSVPVPIPDIFTILKVKKPAFYLINFHALIQSSSGNTAFLSIYINGKEIDGQSYACGYADPAPNSLSIVKSIYLDRGIYFIQVLWYRPSTGTINSPENLRNLLIQEL